MASERDNAYARAIVVVAAAEGALSTVQDEVFSIARQVTDSEELASTLSDQQVPVARRLQIIEDLLGGRADPTTVALVSMIVGTGNARDLPGIADALVALGASETGRQLALVRSAVELSDDQKSRLSEALEQSVGTPVEIRVVIDPAVMGGLVTQVGDTVIDGTVRRRLDQLKQAI
ncbi:MAG: ATP synthase F1 subunit delta [Acidimicrobiales bacterium]|nr:ATP synthase F1 subunit delta [Acidimicrobiales bacterium]